MVCEPVFIFNSLLILVRFGRNKPDQIQIACGNVTQTKRVLTFLGAESSETNGDKSDLIKSLNIRNGEALEARVMKELEEQGLFDPNDEDGAAVEPAKDNDEVFEELLRCQVRENFEVALSVVEEGKINFFRPPCLKAYY